MRRRGAPLANASLEVRLKRLEQQVQQRPARGASRIDWMAREAAGRSTPQELELQRLSSLSPEERAVVEVFPAWFAGQYPPAPPTPPSPAPASVYEAIEAAMEKYINHGGLQWDVFVKAAKKEFFKEYLAIEFPHRAHDDRNTQLFSLEISRDSSSDVLGGFVRSHS